MTITDRKLTSFSIFFIVLVFVLQAVLVYNLYRSKMSALQGEVNMIIDKSYSKDLGIRMGHLTGRNIDTLLKGDNFALLCQKNNPLSSQIIRGGYVSTATISAEQYLSQYHPIEVSQIDSIVALVLQNYDYTLNYSVLLIDSPTKNILQTSKENFDSNNALFVSQDIPLDFKNSKVIRLVAYPETQFYVSIGWMLFLSFILSLACIYCFFLQLRTLSRQRMLSKLKNDFFADVSHELKQPLTVLRQALDSFRNEAILADSAKREHLFCIVDSEITKLDDRLKMVISLTMQNEGLFELHCTDFDLAKVVFDLGDEFLILPAKQIDINIDNDLKDDVVFADKSHIEQVITNLLRNAIKYSDNQVDIDIKLYRDEKNTVLISIKDNGIGINQSDQKIIFEKYSRVDTNSVAKGTGIGLNYIKRVVKKHGGGIILNSELGEGSEFIVWLPQPKKK